ncbi:DNA segregation ATPase FtsK/SpoIIIE related protein [Weissella oryzae SG25]|uniref:DNA segregation ATPase FtsK/SpoIIIE related protein n=1 Tax=Weissella oryzae (strain DSM 25784 / JCM 18191 / LMG 30913 / SG25) TaxID=1329250 RepID=A0A069D3G9_WEIOS|nr:cell division protein FtsK [Weissella oryzae]GAK31936.1 DNA segregation ATPase FtsK/SpoIIIE related protein [Weissella oryzae SG25]
MYRKIKYSDQELAKTLYKRTLLFLSVILFVPVVLFWVHLIETGYQDKAGYFVPLVVIVLLIAAGAFYLFRLYKYYGLKHDNWLSRKFLLIETRQLFAKLVISRGMFDVSSDDKGEYISYFPLIRIKFNYSTGQLFVEQPVDGEKYMDTFTSGEFNKLIETVMLADLQITEFKKGVLVSTFAFDPIKFRLQLSDLMPTKGVVNILKGIDWKYDKFYNMVVAGNVGTGKSYMLFSILGQLLQITKFITVFDPKRSDLASLKYTKALEGKVFSTNLEINEQVHVFYEEMMLRSAKMEKIKESGKLGAYMDFNFKPHFLFFDEFGAWVEMNVNTAFGSDERKTYDVAMSDMKQIAMLGRELGFYIIIGMQRPSADSLPMSIRNQLNFKVVMGLPTPEVGKMVFPDSDKLLRPLSQDLKGWGFVQSGSSQVRSFFAPEFTKGFNLHEWIEEMDSKREAS